MLEAVLVLAAAVADAFRPRWALLTEIACSATHSPTFSARLTFTVHSAVA